MNWIDEFINWTKNNLILVIIAIVAVLLILILTIVLIKIKSKPKIKKITIDEVFIETLLKGLGGKENIKELSIDNGRLKFNITNLKLLDKPSLDEVSQSGVFITGTFVKVLFKYDSKDIKDALEGVL